MAGPILDHVGCQARKHGNFAVTTRIIPDRPEIFRTYTQSGTYGAGNDSGD
jgi:hypothetical protein